jgi:hypothetical protein
LPMGALRKRARAPSRGHDRWHQPGGRVEQPRSRRSTASQRRLGSRIARPPATTHRGYHARIGERSP